MRAWRAGAVVVIVGCAQLVASDGGAASRTAGGRTGQIVHADLAATVGVTVPVGAAATPSGQGYWFASTDGVVTAEGDAVWHGDVGGVTLAAPVVSMASTPTGGGYWLMGGDGGVFNFGDARFLGSVGNIHLNQPVLQIASTPTGNGYWLVARDGGIFDFGDARFLGSVGNIHLNQPVVGMAATPTGNGYWLVARDGGIFDFGDARFFGSTGAVRLNQPVVGMAATPDGGGYWLVARDGGIFTFGDAHFFGSAGGSRLPAPAIGILPSIDGGGYCIVLGNGQVVAYGDADPISFPGVPGAGYSLVGQVVGIDPGHNGGNGSDPAYVDRPVWNGRAYEPCDTSGTETASGYTEASFNFDVATRLAALLRSYGATVVMTRSTDTGVGPCVDQRAAIVNGAGSDAAVDIHADGGPPGGYGFSVLEPVADGPNDAVIAKSGQLAVDVRDLFRGTTGEPTSTYDGVNGLQPRGDLAGLNLTTVPKVLIECANMQNGGDAAAVTNPAWRQSAAQGLADGLSRFLVGFP